MSTPDVLLRALLVVAFAAIAISSVVADRRRSPSGDTAVPRGVTLRPTPLERRPDGRRRVVLASELTAGAIVAGAMLALVVSVVIAYLVTSITGLVS